MEPQINANERRLVASYQENILAGSEKDYENHQFLSGNEGIYKNQPKMKRKLLQFIIDKSDAINLRLSAFICGLIKSQKSRQTYFLTCVKLPT